MIFDVSHRTSYRYRNPVAQSHHVVHLTPRELTRQQIMRHGLLIEPAPAARIDRTDNFGNAASILIIDEEHTELVIHARSTINVKPLPKPNLDASLPWEAVTAAARRGNELDLDVLQFTLPSRHTRTSRALLDFARGSFPAGKPVLAGAWDLTRRVFKEFSFDPTATDISTPVEQVLRDKRGVCQDFAHLMLAAMRSLGLPARYVSGYLMTLPPPGMVRLQGADASHAWISAWSPEAGWIDFDPTNGVIPSEQHITVAYGRDYDDVSPISGVLLGGGDQVISVGVDVIPDAA
jgi:transglutaminase-like putative cysteine protease